MQARQARRATVVQVSQMFTIHIFTYFPVDRLQAQQRHRNVTSLSENDCSSSSDMLMQLVCIHDWQQSQQMLACVSVQFWRHTRHGYASIRTLFWRYMTTSFRMVPQCPQITTFIHVTDVTAFTQMALLTRSSLCGGICEFSNDLSWYRNAAHLNVRSRRSSWSMSSNLYSHVQQRR